MDHLGKEEVPALVDKESDTTEPSKEQKVPDASLESSTLESDKKPETTDNSNSGGDQYAENVHYEGDLAIYTDPTSKYQYIWDNIKNEWKPREIHAEVVSSEGEAASASKSSEIGNPETSEDGAKYGYENDTHTYTDAEGVVYIWDKEKNAWFPKIDDYFMARYQMSYGFVDNTSSDKDKEETKKEDKKEKETAGSGDLKRKLPQEPTWFEPTEDQNTKVYVSNLPLDITEEEFCELMSKCGMIFRDPQTQKMKVKMYMEPGTNILKGDALCTYIRVESVDLAINLLDGSDFRDKKIKVQRAKFEMKGAYNPALKPKKKKKKEVEKIKKLQQRLFDWRPEKMRGERSKHERVVVIRNLFEPALFDTEVELILEFQEDLREECTKCGTVRRVVIYDRHPEGIAQITMAEPEEADAVVLMLNGRWFNKRQLTAEIWDGRTKFKIGETHEEADKRLTKWDKFLETDGTSKSEVPADNTSATKPTIPEINVENQ